MKVKRGFLVVSKTSKYTRNSFFIPETEIFNSYQKALRVLKKINKEYHAHEFGGRMGFRIVNTNHPKIKWRTAGE